MNCAIESAVLNNNNVLRAALLFTSHHASFFFSSTLSSFFPFSPDASSFFLSFFAALRASRFFILKSLPLIFDLSRVTGDTNPGVDEEDDSRDGYRANGYEQSDIDAENHPRRRIGQFFDNKCGCKHQKAFLGSWE